MDYSALWAEIQANPACAEYVHTNEMPKLAASEAAAKDTAIADIINAARPPVRRSVPVDEVFDVFFMSGDYYTLKQAQLSGNPTAVAVFEMLKDSKTLGSGVVNLSAPTVQAMVASLTSQALLSQAGVDALDAIGWAKQSPVTADDVSRAVRGPRE